jgi:hypothetical protein
LLVAFRIGVNAETRLHCLQEFHAAYVAAFGEPQRVPARVVWTKGPHGLADPLHGAQTAPLASQIPVDQVGAEPSAPTAPRQQFLDVRQLTGGFQHEER